MGEFAPDEGKRVAASADATRGHITPRATPASGNTRSSAKRASGRKQITYESTCTPKRHASPHAFVAPIDRTARVGAVESGRNERQKLPGRPDRKHLEGVRGHGLLMA